MVKTMYKYHLEDVEWGEFKIGGKDGIFKVSNSKPYHKANLTVSSNGIPYITRTSINNGLEDLIIDENYEKNPRNTISLGAENADFFFQCIEYVSGNKMYCINNNEITREVGLFLVQVFRQSIKECGFGYGKGLTGTRFKNRYVMLPIDEKNNPNWHFMEEYIKEREHKQRNDLKEYYKSRLLDLVICPEVLTDVKWGEFFLGDVFTIDTKPSKGLNHLKKDKKNGISYIGATNRNNGVLDFVEDDLKRRYEGNCIAFIRNGEGSMGYSIYKKESFLATQDISVGYNDNLNEYSAKFITTIADRVRGKYTFGYKRNQARLKKEILTLPIDKNGNPHWVYMENFIKHIEQKQIKAVLKYLDK